MPASTPPDPALEAAEVAARLDAWRAAPAPIAAAEGISAAAIAGGACLAVASHPESRILNHAIGARRSGLRRLVTETGVPGPDGPGPSFRNILRAGFREIEVRPNLASPPRRS